MEGHTSSVLTVAVTSDNKYIVSGSRNKTIRIWSLLEKDKKLFYKDNEKVLKIQYDKLTRKTVQYRISNFKEYQFTYK